MKFDTLTTYNSQASNGRQKSEKIKGVKMESVTTILSHQTVKNCEHHPSSFFFPATLAYLIFLTVLLFGNEDDIYKNFTSSKY